VLQSEYNFCLSPSRPLLLQSEYTLCWNPSIPYFRERERVSFFYRFTPTLSGKSVCGQLLIRSILVLLFNFEVPLKKNYKKKRLQQEKKIEKTRKKATTKKGLCVCFLFFCAVVLCDYLCVQARVSSTV
jgi:hypothetical protein